MSAVKENELETRSTLEGASDSVAHEDKRILFTLRSGQMPVAGETKIKLETKPRISISSCSSRRGTPVNERVENSRSVAPVMRKWKNETSLN